MKVCILRATNQSLEFNNGIISWERVILNFCDFTKVFRSLRSNIGSNPPGLFFGNTWNKIAFLCAGLEPELTFDGFTLFLMFQGKMFNKGVLFAVISVIILCPQSLIICYSKLVDHGRVDFMPKDAKEILVFIAWYRLSMMLSMTLTNSCHHSRVQRRV